jgi:membrane associated rhomboid family serine protease
MRLASIGYQCPDCASDSTPIIRGIKKNSFIPSQENNQATKFLSISLITVYVAQFVFGDILISNFALFAPSVSTGQWWRLITAGFLH